MAFLIKRKLDWLLIKADWTDRLRRWRYEWWSMFGFPHWPSLDAWQATKLGLSPIRVIDREGNQIERVASVDFQSGEVVTYHPNTKLVEYQDVEVETHSKFYKACVFLPQYRMVIVADK